MESEGGIVGPRDDGVHELGENLSSLDIDTGIVGPLDDDASPSTYQIFVKKVDGKTLTFDVYDNFYTQSLKVLVWQATGTPPHSQRLIYKGRQLKDGTLLVACGVEVGTTLDLMMSLSGGMPPRQQKRERVDSDGADNDRPHRAHGGPENKRELLRDLKSELNAKIMTVGQISVQYLQEIATEVRNMMTQAETAPTSSWVTKVVTQLGTEPAIKEARLALSGSNNASHRMKQVAKLVFVKYYDMISDTKKQLTVVEGIITDALEYMFCHQFCDSKACYLIKAARAILEETEKSMVRHEGETIGEQRARSSGSVSGIASGPMGPMGMETS